MNKEMKNSIRSTLKVEETLEMVMHMLLIKPKMLERTRTMFQKLKMWVSRLPSFCLRSSAKAFFWVKIWVLCVRNFFCFLGANDISFSSEL